MRWILEINDAAQGVKYTAEMDEDNAWTVDPDTLPGATVGQIALLEYGLEVLADVEENLPGLDIHTSRYHAVLQAFPGSTFIKRDPPEPAYPAGVVFD